MARYELGFIGAGNMAEAIARAAIERDVLSPDRMIACDPSEPRRALFAELGVAVTDAGERVVRESEHVLLAVKPQSLDQIAPWLERLDADASVVISIMAGVRSERIEQAAGRALRVVRVMPNTPLMVGVGMTGVALGAHAREGDDELTLGLFAAAGEAVRVSEDELDAITAVSGSGPAYLFYLAGAMEAAARELGLEEHAQTLVEQTLLGAATLCRRSDDDAATLRRKVSSPGGTTEAAIRTLDAQGVREAILAAVRAARDRSLELGR